MNERIKKLTELTLAGQMFPKTVQTEFDSADLALSKQDRESKRLCEYILNQEPKITEYSSMTGFFKFDGSRRGDAFGRSGHKETSNTMWLFYLKPIDNLTVLEWQHATADYQKILNKGISGIIDEIDESLKLRTNKEQVEFLRALKRVANALIGWANKCSKRALEFSQSVENSDYRSNLIKLSEALKRVPENAPETFY
jgi:hypothetical protein